MRNVGIHIVLVLLIGALLTFGLAWGAAVFAPSDRMQGALEGPTTGDAAWWQLRIPAELLTFVSADESPRSVRVPHDGLILDLKQYLLGNWALHATALRVRAGWPFRALEGSQWSGDLTKRGAPVNAVEGAWLLQIKWIGERVVPWRPMWRGLLANVAILGVAGWTVSQLTIVTYRRRRTARRRKTGKCAACGYPLVSDQAIGEIESVGRCPECGAAGLG